MDRSREHTRTPGGDAHVGGEDHGAAASQRAMIRMLLRQTPEQRLRGLVNAARFFADARRE